MSGFVLPIIFALFVWWFSTGAIIWLDGLPRHTFKWSMAGATVLAAASLYGLALSSADASVSGAYLAFASALGLWAWHEISFYMGYVTGPRRHACAKGCSGWAHFGHAVQVSLWHELAILASFALVLTVTMDMPNQTGLWTFVILWVMHESARFNVFLGVRNLNAHFLPPHLAYLESFLTSRPMNLLFPVSVTVSTAICSVLATEAALASDGFTQAGYTLLATIFALAIIEHWFLVLPIPAEAMWNWSMASRNRDEAGDHAAAHAAHRKHECTKTVTAVPGAAARPVH